MHVHDHRSRQANLEGLRVERLQLAAVDLVVKKDELIGRQLDLGCREEQGEGSCQQDLGHEGGRVWHYTRMALFSYPPTLATGCAGRTSPYPPTHTPF